MLKENSLLNIQKPLGLPKSARICKRDDFAALFKDGKSLFSYPFCCYYLLSQSDKPSVRMAVSVRKKQFKKAVDRNRIKRLMKEVFRLNQHLFREKKTDKHYQLDLFFVYSESKILPFFTFSEKFKILANKVLKEIERS